MTSINDIVGSSISQVTEFHKCVTREAQQCCSCHNPIQYGDLMMDLSAQAYAYSGNHHISCGLVEMQDYLLRRALRQLFFGDSDGAVDNTIKDSVDIDLRTLVKEAMIELIEKAGHDPDGELGTNDVH